MYIHVHVQYIHSVDAAIGWPSKHAGHPLLYAALPDAVQSPGTQCSWFVVSHMNSDPYVYIVHVYPNMNSQCKKRY